MTDETINLQEANDKRKRNNMITLSIIYFIHSYYTCTCIYKCVRKLFCSAEIALSNVLILIIGEDISARIF